MNIGELIERLEQEPQDLVLPIGWAEPHSYRGFYSELGVERREDVTVAECVAVLRSAIGATYQGWKGGEFTMDKWADVYLVREEGCTGEEVGPYLLDLDVTLARERVR